MKLRDRSSIKGKKPLYEESSDDDDRHDVDEDMVDLASSDSDYNETVDKALDEDEETAEIVVEVDGEDEGLDLDLDLDDGHEAVAEDIRNKPEIEVPVYEDEQAGHLMEVDVRQLQNINNQKKKRRKRKRKCNPTLLWEVWEEELEKWLDDNMTIDTDLNTYNEVVPETAEPPPELIMPLLRYQKEWLAWALNQEESDAKGGILADEMGMGKTVQAISLVLAKRALLREIGEPNGILPSTSSSQGLPVIKATLVICPVVAVTQWVSEIDRFTAKGTNKVLVYHGAKRAKSVPQFSEYDFIITTYSIVEAEYRKNVMPPKHRCQWCGKLFYENKMAVHLKYFCGPQAKKTDKQSKQQSKEQMHGSKLSKQKKTFDEGLTIGLEDFERKRGRKKNNKKCSKEEGSGAGCSNAEKDVSAQKSYLHSVKWDRIILDEAHYIKDRRCNTTRAVLALESSYKWALSGTPLQNRVGELYSLVRFLQITPYSYYFCKDCDCRALDYSSSTGCPYCEHKSVRHFCWWNKNVANPIQSYGNEGDGKRAMIVLKHKILKKIVLRRTKKGRAADLALPPRIVLLRRDSLDIKEEDYYTSLYNETQAQFNTYVVAGTVANNYAHIFDLLTRLRQAVDHPYLVVCSRAATAKAEALIEASSAHQLCARCHDTVEDPVVASCTHVFCKSCLTKFSEDDEEQVTCPTCSKPLTVDFSSNTDQVHKTIKTTVQGFRSTSILNRICLDDFQTSTKIDALREEIRFMVERDGSAKGIVFSQFTTFLDLIHYSLQKSGVSCVQLDGSMNLSAKDAAITKFTQDPDCRIFLMSLKAGGVALNLTVASHVFLMDPWWNPAVERQAQDRIHRIGQYKPIRIVRFVIENTIEERILKLQEKKELVFEGTVGGSMEALGKLTEADMRFLFT